MKKILTLDALCQFCEQNQFSAFDSATSGYSLVVQVPATFEEEKQEDELTLYGVVKLMHSGLNRNRSSLTDEAANACLSTIAYKPVLANFTDVNGEEDFTSHDIETYTDDDGNEIAEYIEHQVGCFTADEPWIERDPSNGRNYIYAKVAIPREYTHAAEIIERKGGTKVSAELNIRNMTYDADEQVLYLNAVDVMGVTLLGVSAKTGEAIEEGMEGAKLITDFSQENNSIKFEVNKDMVDTLIERMDTLLDAINKNERKEDQSVGTDDFETVSTSEAQPVELTEPETPDMYAVTLSDGTVHQFELSLNEKQRAIVCLVNDTYCEADQCWYWCDVYDDYVIMYSDPDIGGYRQNYEENDGVFALVGERIPVRCKWLTEEEEAVIDGLRTEKENLEAQLADVNAQLGEYVAAAEAAEVDKLANSDEYAVIANDAEFTKLIESKADYDAKSFKAKADAILLSYAKQQFTKKPERPVVGLPFEEKPKKRPYGGLFD